MGSGGAKPLGWAMHCWRLNISDPNIQTCLRAGVTPEVESSTLCNSVLSKKSPKRHQIPSRPRYSGVYMERVRFRHQLESQLQVCCDMCVTVLKAEPAEVRSPVPPGAQLVQLGEGAWHAGVRPTAHSTASFIPRSFVGLRGAAR